MRHPYDDMRSTSPLAMMIDPDASAVSHERPYRSIDPMRPERREPVAPPKRGTSGVYELPDRHDIGSPFDPGAQYQAYLGRMASQGTWHNQVADYAEQIRRMHLQAAASMLSQYTSNQSNG